MRDQNPGPVKRAGVWLQGTALLFSAVLSGCQSPQQALQELAASHAQRLEVMPSQPFPLALVSPLTRPVSPRLRIYLEGDGHAWATPTQPSLDPSPRQLLVARLALSDPTLSLYLARPCQFVDAPGCNTQLWTDQRFSAAVVTSLSQALDRIKLRYGNEDFELVGYSGGGALALLLAAQRNDIAQVQTLAGNLSPRQWVLLLNLSPLKGSLEPLDYRAKLARVPQRHFTGTQDRVVPATLLDRYRQALGPARCLQSVSVAGASHAEGWNQAWAQWRDRPIECQ
jgi:pimeloyl-ACP methyl ester carboxylesterase